jgi:trigger factor
VKVNVERLPESRVQLDIEIDAERLEKSLNSAYKRVAGKARIPGFRPGKAPRPIVERLIGREGLIREALDTLVPDVYNEAIEAESVEAVAQPDLEILEIEPVRFKATVAVRPTVELGDYKSVRVTREPVEVTGELVEEQILGVRRRLATHVPVERPVQWDDILIADVFAEVDAEPFVEDNDAEFVLREGQTLLLPGLSEQFVGMTRGEEKTCDLPIPEDFQVERFQGKTATLKITLKEVKEEQLPDEDEELAQQVDEKYETMDALREAIREDIQRHLDRDADAKLQQEALDKMVEVAALEYPRVYVEREIDGLINETLGNNRQNYLDYLSRLGQSETDYRATVAEAAERRVRRSLVLGALSEAEAVEVTDAEVDAELDKLVAPAGEDAGRLRELFASAEGAATIRRNLVTERTLERLRAIATADGGAPAPAQATTEKPKTARSKSSKAKTPKAEVPE